MENQYDILPTAASTHANGVDWLFTALVGISVFFTVLIVTLLIVLSIKYRRRSEHDEVVQVHGSWGLEMLWTVVPLVIVMATFAWGSKLFFDSYEMPSDAMEVLVTGKQWMWKIQHPNGKREINSLHVPKGEPVKLNISSEDVIHSFYIPAFRIKKDAVPGRFNMTWFEATKTGEYHLFCAEYCGTDHSTMIGTVTVMEPEEYQRWLEIPSEGGTVVTASAGGAGGGLSMADQGEQIFNNLGCTTCHQAGPTQQGPALAGRFGKEETLASGKTVTVDENYIRKSILNPRADVVEGYAPIMPTYKGQVNQEQIGQIVAYIKSLEAAEPSTETAQ